MRTPICDPFGIEFPMFAFTHCRDVAAAVTKAGGFGVLGRHVYARPARGRTRLDRGRRRRSPVRLDIMVPAKYSARARRAAAGIES